MDSKLVLNKDTLLYRLLTTYGGLHCYSGHTDSCAVLSACLKGAIAVLGLIFIGAFFGAAFILLPGFVVFNYFMYGIIAEGAWPILVITGVIAIVLLCFWISVWLERYRKHKMFQTTPKKPSVLKRSIKAFKDKYCIYIEVK